MSYCLKCGGTHKLISGEPCPDCIQEIGFDSIDLIGLEVPEQYVGLKFDKSYLAGYMELEYGEYLEELSRNIINTRLTSKNIFISSPMDRGKSVFAYYCMQALYRKGLSVFPYLDILEIRRLMFEADNYGKTDFADELRVSLKSLYEVPYLFVRVPLGKTYNVYDSLVLLIQRRVRRGKSTIILSQENWESFVENDKKEVLKCLKGDGSFHSIEVKDFGGNI